MIVLVSVYEAAVMNMNNTTALKESDVECGKRYFTRAIPLMLILFLLAKAAPNLPTGFLMLVIIVYAFIAMVGSLHFVVMRRMLRQYKLREEGDLSKLNRKWTIYLIGLFVLGLLSGLLFLLEAPGWGYLEWILFCVAIPLYFIVFIAMLRRLKREYADQFDKTAAMKWAFWATGAFLCLLYVVFSALEAPSENISMYAAFNEARPAFDESSCALFSALESLTSFLEGLKIYAVRSVPNGYAIVGVIVKVILFASVFFGLASQFCFCLLDKGEKAAEFHKLPLKNEDAKGPLVKRYFVALIALVIAFCILFLVANHQIAQLRSTGNVSFIEAQVEKGKQELILIYDAKADESRTAEEMRDALGPLLDDYYDQCISNVDSYVNDHSPNRNNPLDAINRWLGSPFGSDENKVREEFVEQITANADDSEIVRQYGEYRQQLIAQRDSVNELSQEVTGYSITEVGLPETLDLWQSLSDENVREVLMNDELSSQELKDKIVALIEESHAAALQTIESGA